MKARLVGGRDLGRRQKPWVNGLQCAVGLSCAPADLGLQRAIWATDAAHVPIGMADHQLLLACGVCVEKVMNPRPNKSCRAALAPGPCNLTRASVLPRLMLILRPCEQKTS